MKNIVLRATASNDDIRVFVANTTQMVEEARKIHDASPVAIAALGRTMTATSIMGLMLKNEGQMVTVRINGNGPLGPIVVVSDHKGMVKGYVSNPHVEGSNIRPGKLNVGEAVGRDGKITVIRDLGLKEPYSGTYELATGEIAEDFASYFFYSEQQPSVVALGVLVDTDYTVKAAGGFIIQVLPGASDETIDKLEKKIETFEPITKLMERGFAEEDILNYILGEFDVRILDRNEVGFVCDCSIERFERALISLGRRDLEEIIREDKGAELHCHFCNHKYFFNEDHLLSLIQK
ncbi:Hsp33 family molecular chaperone HslO [Serpentinicella alkaliphila]|uniref:33 kDa chaperonin n=1 Tax=Serpentinicella alkaliphila TaxID=1734049 RepID=A0A4R2TL63_9FIRM|nr:Hsp33 family molecular chaperone HslO [Serpentinicella alkaliphila]QUH24455.1 Hsp33 family molecular chaperone HslO [Serpentinicella alkaliphila]TCQ04151.1 molecular chaperone Hsp33 [Serpentinicella alkaliphila]